MIRINLKREMEARRMSIRELSNRLDMGYESVRRIYHEMSLKVTLTTIEKICRELNCDIGDLLTLEDDEKVDSEESVEGNTEDSNEDTGENVDEDSKEESEKVTE